MRPGEGTGYGLKTPSTEPATIAVVPAGYADGLDLRLAGRGYMLVRGRRAPIVGSVCMDMTMIDVTGTDVAPGDEVVIIGEQGERDRSTCAKWPRRSARFRTSCCAGWAHGSSGCMSSCESADARLLKARSSDARSPMRLETADSSMADS